MSSHPTTESNPSVPRNSGGGRCSGHDVSAWWPEIENLRGLELEGVQAQIFSEDTVGARLAHPTVALPGQYSIGPPIDCILDVVVHLIYIHIFFLH